MNTVKISGHNLRCTFDECIVGYYYELDGTVYLCANNIKEKFMINLNKALVCRGEHCGAVPFTQLSKCEIIIKVSQ